MTINFRPPMVHGAENNLSLSIYIAITVHVAIEP